MPVEVIEVFREFGVAGLMGMLWVWERTQSRRREKQLNEAHDQITRQRDNLDLLVKLVRHNTRAIEQFEQTQSRLRTLLEKLHDGMRNQAA